MRRSVLMHALLSGIFLTNITAATPGLIAASPSTHSTGTLAPQLIIDTLPASKFSNTVSTPGQAPLISPLDVLDQTVVRHIRSRNFSEARTTISEFMETVATNADRTGTAVTLEALQGRLDYLFFQLIEAIREEILNTGKASAAQSPEDGLSAWAIADATTFLRIVEDDTDTEPAELAAAEYLADHAVAIGTARNERIKPLIEPIGFFLTRRANEGAISQDFRFRMGRITLYELVPLQALYRRTERRLRQWADRLAAPQPEVLGIKTSPVPTGPRRQRPHRSNTALSTAL